MPYEKPDYAHLHVQALVNVDTTNNASLASLVTWPADPGQINDYFYYRIPSQVPIYTESNFQGASNDMLMQEVEAGNMKYLQGKILLPVMYGFVPTLK